MRIFILLLFAAFSLTGFAADMDFSKAASGKPELLQPGPNKAWCPVCGMSIKMFYKTSHALKLSGGVNKQYCSIRCMLQDYEGLQSIVKEILVVDAATEKLIDARKATYVVGSDAPGTMTMTSKYAFASKTDAEAFQKEMGGELMSFDAAERSAMESMDKDVAMTNMKRQKMMYPKGKKIFESACDKSLDPMQYNLINELKADIKGKKLCGELSEKDLQAVALYLWDVYRRSTNAEVFITVTEEDKCPVCGMFVYKYPKWAAKINFESAKGASYAAFDGTKDMLKFYFNPAKWSDTYKGIKIKEALVTDYYTNRALKAENAFFVIGSDVYGPMGKDLMPFASKDNAETFMRDHSGEKIVTFKDINEELVYSLDK